MTKSQSKSFFLRLLAFNTFAFFISTTEAVDGQTRPKVYTCPGDNGVQYTTPNGITFQLLCGQGTTAKRLDEGRKFSQTACADWCSESPECQSCDWNAQTKNCVRFSEYIPTVPNPNVNTWFPLEERQKPAPRPDASGFDEPKCPKNPDIIIENANAAEFAGISSQEGLCPTYDGKTYITNEGSYFKTRCGHHHKNAAAKITSTTSVTLAECAEFCGITTGCQSVAFHPTSFTCDLYGTGESDIVPCPMADKHNAAYLIDPPTYEIKDEITIKCSTTCPGAHGQTFEENGVAFRMTCCKRHGVVPFAVEQMPSFTECMKACSMVTSCASVDYHERSGQCYFGKHFGEATVAAPGWASAYSIGCAGACKKNGCCSGCGSQEQPKSEL